MPPPLIIKRQPELSLIGQVMAVVFIGGPLFALWQCFKHDQVISLDNPWLNLGVHISLFIVPLIWAGFFFAKPISYKTMDGETILGTSTYFSRWPVNWWMMFMMWATPVFGSSVLGYDFFTRYLAHPENLSTSPGKALAIIFVLFALGSFYWTLLLSRHQTVIWISDAGLRTSILRFHEWKNIHHLSQHRNFFALYDRANPDLPANAFKVQDREAQMLLDRHLGQQEIRIVNGTSPALPTVKIIVVIGFFANIALCLGLRLCTSLAFVVLVLISFGMGIVMTLLLEKFRGVSKYGRGMPVIEPPNNGEIGDAPRPTV